MHSLILPVSGKSSRFPSMRPKWLLTMPDGKLMYEKSIELLDLTRFDNIFLVCLQEHLDKYTSVRSLKESFRKNYDLELKVMSIEKSDSQSSTVNQLIKEVKLGGSFVVKDCDNIFNVDCTPGNFVGYLSINDFGLIDAKNKSYINIDNFGNITNIVEKKVISTDFCVGSYGFESTKDFVDGYSRISNNSNSKTQEIYISHIIYSLLLKNKIFIARKSSNYIDFGTLREYRHYVSKSVTIFCDVDGVLLENGSKFAPDGWRTRPILKNIQSIKKLQNEGFVYLVITTSRPESEKEYLLDLFNKEGLKVSNFLFGMPHTRRILINDFSNTNPYPSAVSVNIERNSPELSSLMGYLFPID